MAINNRPISKNLEDFRIRVLHVVLSLEPGGMENGVVNVCNGLWAEGIESGVACLERRGQFADRLVSGVATHVLDKPPGKSFRTVLRLMQLIRRWRPDVVHTHNLGPLIYGALATLGGRSSAVLHGEHGEFSAAELAPDRLRLRRQFYRAASAVHSVSASLTRSLEGLHLQASPVRTLRNGVDTRRFSPGDRRAARLGLGLGEQRRVVGMVGRFGPYKRHVDLIAAFEQVGSEAPEWDLLLVGGGGPEESAVRTRVAASPLRDRIYLSGFQADPVPAYRAMDLMVLPSVLEGLSNAVLEAMSCGVPVVSHHACGVAEVLEHGSTGWVNDLGTVERLAAALRYGMAAPDRDRIGRAARDRAQKELSITSMLTAYRTLYRELSQGSLKGRGQSA